MVRAFDITDRRQPCPFRRPSVFLPAIPRPGERPSRRRIVHPPPRRPFRRLAGLAGQRPAARTSPLETRVHPPPPHPRRPRLTCPASRPHPHHVLNSPDKRAAARSCWGRQARSGPTSGCRTPNMTTPRPTPRSVAQRRTGAVPRSASTDRRRASAPRTVPRATRPRRPLLPRCPVPERAAVTATSPSSAAEAQRARSLHPRSADAPTPSPVAGRPRPTHIHGSATASLLGDVEPGRPHGTAGGRDCRQDFRPKGRTGPGRSRRWSAPRW